MKMALGGSAMAAPEYLMFNPRRPMGGTQRAAWPVRLSSGSELPGVERGQETTVSP